MADSMGPAPGKGARLAVRGAGGAPWESEGTAAICSRLRDGGGPTPGSSDSAPEGIGGAFEMTAAAADGFATTVRSASGST